MSHSNKRNDGSSSRLNDTQAIVAMVPYESEHNHYSRTVRPLENGFLVREFSQGTSNDPNHLGDSPISREYYSEQHPDNMGRDPHVCKPTAMKRAVDYLKK
jgi:hypothetical protein